MTKIIRFNEDDFGNAVNISVVSYQDVNSVESLQEAFAEFGIDVDSINGEIIDNATERWLNGWVCIDVEEIENEIYEHVSE